MRARAKVGNWVKSSAWPASLLLIALTLWLFYPTVSYEFLNFDDPALLTRNPLFLPLSWENFWSFWNPVLLWEGRILDYSPIRDWSYAFDLGLWGWDATGFHLTQVLLHAGNVALFFLLLRRRFRPLGALMGAAFFAFHPLVVEPVAWISSRKDLLALFFFLLTLLLLDLQKPKWGILAGFFSVLTKYVGIVIAPLLILRDYSEKKKPLFITWLLLAFSVLFAVFVFLANRNEGGLVQDRELWFSIKGVFWSFSFHFSKILWPFELSARYAQPLNLAWFDPMVLIGVGILFAVLALGIGSYLKNAKVFEAWLVFALPWGPNVLQILAGHPIWVADRYLYFVLPGLIWLVMTCGRLILKRSGLLLPALALISVCLAAVSLSRMPVWENSRTLWTDTVQKSPELYYAWANLGLVELNQGNFEKAKGHFQRAIQLDPNWARGQLHLAEALVSQGKLVRGQAALRAFEEKATPREKEELLLNRAVLFARLRYNERASELFNERLERAPGDPLAWSNYGAFLANAGREEEAARAWLKAIEINPNLTDPRFNLAQYYLIQGKCELLKEQAETFPEKTSSKRRILDEWTEVCQKR